MSWPFRAPAAGPRLAAAFDLALPRRFRFARLSLDDQDSLVGRIGYTAEDGVEILCQPPVAARLWTRLARQATPAGFRAADLLRLEAGLPLFAREFALGVTAAEAGLAAIRANVPPSPPELSRLRAVTQPATADPMADFSPARRRPAAGEMAITSAAPLTDNGGTLVMGYAHRNDLSKDDLKDPQGIFRDVHPIALKGPLGQ